MLRIEGKTLDTFWDFKKENKVKCLSDKDGQWNRIWGDYKYIQWGREYKMENHLEIMLRVGR